MEISNLTPREKLQLVYELAFFPPRLSEFWSAIRRHELTDKDLMRELIQSALLLHRALPETGFASIRALKRLAGYQAASKPFVPETFLRNIAGKLNVPISWKEEHVPAGMIRDVGLPAFCHAKTIGDVR